MTRPSKPDPAASAQPAHLTDGARERLAADEGLLIGSGGGFMMRYTAFAVASSGATELRHYTVDYNGDIDQLQAAPLLLHERSQEYQRLLALAVSSGFFDLQLPPPSPSGGIRLTGVTHPEHGSQLVTWSPDTEPAPPASLVALDRELRDFLVSGFREEFENP